MSELALDDVERRAFPCHLDRMGVTQLVWGKATTDPCPGRVGRSAIRACELDHDRPQVGPLITQKSGPIGSDTQVSSQG